MPAYDFRCKSCRHTFTLTVNSYKALDTIIPACTSCESIDLSRLIKRVNVLTTDQQRAERLSEPSLLANLDPDDPRAMGKVMRMMANESGEPLDGEVGEVVERLEAGEDSASIEQSLDLNTD